MEFPATAGKMLVKPLGSTAADGEVIRAHYMGQVTRVQPKRALQAQRRTSNPPSKAIKAIKFTTRSRLLSKVKPGRIRLREDIGCRAHKSITMHSRFYITVAPGTK